MSSSLSAERVKCEPELILVNAFADTCGELMISEFIQVINQERPVLSPLALLYRIP